MRLVETVVEDLLGEEVVLHELAERLADLILAVRDDRRVRNGHAERMTEQCGDREPVGERADHRRLGEGADGSDGRVVRLLPAGDEVDDRDEHQQTERERLHPAHRCAPLEIVRRQLLHMRNLDDWFQGVGGQWS